MTEKREKKPSGQALITETFQHESWTCSDPAIYSVSFWLSNIEITSMSVSLWINCFNVTRELYESGNGTNVVSHDISADFNFPELVLSDEVVENAIKATESAL